MWANASVRFLGVCACVGGNGVWLRSTGFVSCIYGVEPFLTMGGFLAVSIRAALELYDAPPPSLITATSLHVCLATKPLGRQPQIFWWGRVGNKWTNLSDELQKRPKINFKPINVTYGVTSQPFFSSRLTDTRVTCPRSVQSPTLVCYCLFPWIWPRPDTSTWPWQLTD